MSRLSAIVVALLLGLLGFGAGLHFQGGTVADRETDRGVESTPVAVPKIELSGAVDSEALDRPAFNFVDQHGNERSVAEWDGKVIVLNFWATWCPPCLEEIPLFVEAQKTLGPAGAQFVGVALDDSDEVRAFTAEMAVNYPTANGQQNALDLMRAYGNKTGGLPFTVIIDRKARITYRKAGVFTREELAEALTRHGLKFN